MISWSAILTIAYKEFIHVWRDRRVMFLLVVLPPFFTFLFGHAFEGTSLRDVPAMYFDADNSKESREFLDRVKAKDTFLWKAWRGDPKGQIDLFRAGVQAAIVIPEGWGDGLRNGEPLPIRLVLDGTDTNTAPSVQGVLQEVLGDYQSSRRDNLIENLPDEIIDLGKNLPLEIRHEFSSMMTPWEVKAETLYNPKLLFIDYVVPGIVGLILQLLTVTLIASAITREREVGTLSQLLVTPLRHSEVVIGKVLPYLVISMFLIASTIAVGNLHFGVKFHEPVLLTITCFLFLLFSLGLGLLISAFSRTQTQAIQISVFFLLPVFLLSGAFAPLEQLPRAVRICSELFPLTHFCRAFRSVNLYNADVGYIAGDLLFLAIGSVLTCAGAAYLLRGIED
ncbi:MAG TPA: ABC transporter permease [Chthoniobacterales bacterium]|jgi:ABC-type multidrug transport system permease subunit|nr:ABC transporter permease [Chthoniobacterales bacterium]